MYLLIVVLLVSSLGTLGAESKNRKFPANFKIGTASASYQVEGAWNEDGKGESIWDHGVHEKPDRIVDHSNGDVACDSYHKYKEDIAILKELGVDFYRFSLSWPRILPNGYANETNPKGIEYYQKLIQLLLDNNIEPMVTIYHWDLPQIFQESFGGMTSPKIIEPFADYARLVFKLFGDKVKIWSTFNEPLTLCQVGYSGQHAPFINSDGIGTYQCAHNLLKAHARAYHIYHDELKLDGKVSLVLPTGWAEPATKSKKDVEAALRSMEFNLGWYANPVFLGNYPKIMIDVIGRNSKAQGFNVSRLPTFTQEEIDYIKGTHDYFGLNYYTSTLIKYIPDNVPKSPGFYSDINVNSYVDPTWEKSASSWLKVVPWGIRKLLKYIKNKYNNPEIIITENGFSDTPGTIDDQRRINYYREHLRNVLDAIEKDKVNVTGFTAWSLMDNFEWARGYTERFGLIYVDFQNNTQRLWKSSARYFQKVCKTRSYQ